MSVQIESDPGSSPSAMILDILADFCRQFLLNFVKKCDISTQNSKVCIDFRVCQDKIA